MNCGNGKIRNLLFKFYIIYLILLFQGCASSPKFLGKGNLCGLVIDENNRPVKDAVITCWKGAVCIQSAMTNENGIFTFYDISSGFYELSGEKMDYELLDRIKYRFSDSGNIFCCQMSSVNHVLESAEKKLLCGNIKEMIEILDSVLVSKGSYTESAVLFYKACGKYALGEKNAAKRLLLKIKKYRKSIGCECLDEVEKLCDGIIRAEQMKKGDENVDKKDTI
ncbi:MAG: carboxypeptidase regulatory-like domain-containing protein [Treponema sp.]|nr:carboxypeptidase regulatory-like domain-containing protein [Treponema sp.]